MKEDVVNPHWLRVPLEPLAGLADDEATVTRYRILDPGDEHGIRQIIRAEILPYLARIDDESLGKIKNAYRFYLSKNDSQWEYVYNSMLMPFDHPPRARDFFLWIWQESFPKEDWRITDLSRFKLELDIEEPLRTMKLSPGGRSGADTIP